MQPIHDRMPVIVPPRKYRLWLDPAGHSLGVFGPLMVPYDAALMVAFPVSTFVKNRSTTARSASIPWPVPHEEP